MSSLESICLPNGNPLEFPRASIYTAATYCEDLEVFGEIKGTLTEDVQPNITGLGRQTQTLNMNNNDINNAKIINAQTLNAQNIGAHIQNGNITYNQNFGIKYGTGPGTDTVLFDTTNKATFGGDVLVSGNLDVSGSLNYITSSVISTGNASFQFLNANIGDLFDFGIFGKRITNGITYYDGFFRNHADNRFYLYKNYTGSILSNWVNPTRGDLSINDLDINSFSIAGQSVSANSADLNTTAGIYAQIGTAQPLKVLTCNLTKDITGINEISAVKFNGQLSGSLTQQTQQSISYLANLSQNLTLEDNKSIVFGTSTPQTITPQIAQTLISVANGTYTPQTITLCGQKWKIDNGPGNFNGYYTYFDTSEKKLIQYWYDENNDGAINSGIKYVKKTGPNYTNSTNLLELNKDGLSLHGGTPTANYPITAGQNTKITGNLSITGNLEGATMSASLNTNNQDITNIKNITYQTDSTHTLGAGRSLIYNVNSKYPLTINEYGAGIGINSNYPADANYAFKLKGSAYIDGSITQTGTFNATLGAGVQPNIYGLGTQTQSLDMGYNAINKASAIVINSATTPFIQSRLYITGDDSNNLTGPNVSYYTNTSIYPLKHELNYSHDALYSIYDAYYNGTTYSRSSSSAPYAIMKTGGKFYLKYASAGTIGSNFNFNNGLELDSSGNVSVSSLLSNKLYVNSAADPNWTAILGGNTSITGGLAVANNTSSGSFLSANYNFDSNGRRRLFTSGNNTYNDFYDTGAQYFRAVDSSLNVSSIPLTIQNKFIGISGDTKLGFAPDGTQLGAPTYGTTSLGTRIILWPQLSAGDANYSIGMESGHLYLNSSNNTGSGIKFYTGTTQQMRISNLGVEANNLLVGRSTQSSPSAQIDIGGFDPCILLTNTAGTSSVLRLVQSGGANYLQSGAVYSGGSIADLAFTSIFGGYEWMRLNAAGSIGVNGAINTNNDININNSGKVLQTYNIRFNDGFQDAQWLVSNGNFNINFKKYNSNGTLPADNNFTISAAQAIGSNLGSSGTPNFTFKGAENAGLYCDNTYTGIATNGQRCITADNSQNVSIGPATVPDTTYKLYVNGSGVRMNCGSGLTNTSRHLAFSIDGSNQGYLYMKNGPELAANIGGTEQLGINSSGVKFRYGTTLNGYYEGSFTPTITNGTITANTTFIYTRIGRLVNLSTRDNFTVNIAAAGPVVINNLPTDIQGSNSSSAFIRVEQGANIYSGIAAYSYWTPNQLFLYVNALVATNTNYAGSATFNTFSITYSV